jgi:predicted nucleic acid-binding protein
MDPTIQRRLEAAIPIEGRLLLETSCLAAYLDASEDNHPAARHILDAFVASGRNDAVVSMVSVMEILVRPLRATPPSHHIVLSFLRHHPNLVSLPVDMDVAQEAAALRATYRLRPPDALVVGTALAGQIQYVVTNDREWTKRLAPLGSRLSVVTLSAFRESKS